jgi:hypothetical protein
MDNFLRIVPSKSHPPLAERALFIDNQVNSATSGFAFFGKGMYSSLALFGRSEVFFAVFPSITQRAKLHSGFVDQSIFSLSEN